MSSIVILVLVLGYTNACLICCFEKLKLIDCTAVGLRSTPHSKSTLDNYTFILLRDNYFQHLNFSSLFKVKIISDCKYSTTEIPTYSTSEIPATAKQNQIRMIHSLLTLTLKEQPNIIRNKRKPK